MSTSEYPAERFAGPRLSRLGAGAGARPIPADVWAVGVLVVLAAVIRILTIDNQSLWRDEALTAYEAHLPFGAMLNTVAHVETTPPLYFVLIWAWAHVFGMGEVALRSVSTIAGVALVPIAYLCARELVSRRAGVVAAALVAVNPYLIWNSQEARAYMLLAALTGASFLWFIRARRDPSARNLAWWVSCSAVAVMTHFFGGFLVMPEAVWLLWMWRSPAVAAAIGIVGLAQVAMLPFALIDTSHGVGWIAMVPRINRVSQMVSEWGVSIVFRQATIADRLAGAAALIVAIVMLLARGGDRQTRQGATVAAVITGCVLLVPLALGFVGQDYFLPRNVIPAFVPLVTLVAAACVVPRLRVLGGALGIGLLAMFAISAIVVQTTPKLERPDWRMVARSLGPATVPRAILAAGGLSADPLKIYLPGVSWVQSHTRQVLIAEVDVVGARDHFPLARPAKTRAQVAVAQRAGPPRSGSPVPQQVAPPGAKLLSRLHVGNSVLARFMLVRPKRLNIDQLSALAPRFFGPTRASSALLVFTQQPAR